MSIYASYPVEGGGGVSIYPNFASFPATAPTGSLAVDASTGNLYEFNGTTWVLIAHPNPGSVTSVGLADDTGLFTISGSPVTTTGTLTLASLVSQSANTVFAGPTSGGPGTPSFRTLVANDIPNLSATYVTQSEVGASNGVASLDASGKVPSSELPSTVLQYQGLWNPTTNTPTLQDSTGTNGYVYQVSANYAGPIAGLNNSTMVNFLIGNLIIYSGSISQWEQTTPAAGVQSVNGAQGSVMLTVNSANGLAGTYSGTALTLSTTVTGVLKGNGTAISAAIAGTDYVIPSGSITGTAGNITATSNSTLTTLTALSLPTSQLSGDISLTTQVSGILPVVNGGTGVSSVTTVPAPTAWAGWDSNDNMSANNFIGGYTTTTTSTGTTTLSATSTQYQYFTGTLTQTVVLPAVNTLTLGQTFTIVNLSTNNVTIESSGLNAYAIMGTNQYAIVTCISTSGTGTSSWSIQRWLVGASVLVPVGFGGTGQNGALNSQGVIFANTTSMMASTAQGASGTFLGGNGSTAPAFRTLVSGDIPNNAANTTGTAANITATSNSTLTTLTALSLPTSQLSGDISLTTQVSGVLPIANGGTGAATTSQSFVFIGPTSGSGAPSFRTLVASDIPTLNQNTTGTAANITATSNSTLTSLTALTTASSLASVGTITTGVWNGTTIAVANGGTGVTSVTTTPTATSFAGWDANSNLSANNFLEGYQTSSSTNVTLTVSSPEILNSTNSSTQTVTLPDCTTLVTGQSYTVFANGTGTINVNNNGGALQFALTTGESATFTCTSTGSANGSWFRNVGYNGNGLPVALGGTGQTSLTAHDVLVGNGTSSITQISPSTAGKVLTSNGTGADPSFQSLSASLTAPTIQKFTSSSGTYTTPTSPAPLYIRVVMVGGGGGGGGSGTSTGTAGSAGGNSTFGTSLLVANGGGVGTRGGAAGGTGGTASLGSGPVGISLSGGDGGGAGATGTTASYAQGGQGGSSAFGGTGYAGGAANPGGNGKTNTGGGGGGASSGNTANVNAGEGGGAGAYIDAIITSPSSSYSYAVGAAGNGEGAGTSGSAGGNGGSGLITVFEFYQ